MTTFAFIHGAGDVGWYWHLVEAELRRNDRFFPVEWLRGVIRDRLGITPDELDSGHCPALSRPRELADLLAGYVASGS